MTIPQRAAVLVVIALAALVGISEASAHRASVTLSCDQVTFAYTSFPDGESSVSYVVKVDGNTYASGQFTLGSSGVRVVTLSLTGAHSVYAKTWWSADGGGSAEASGTLECKPPPSPGCPDGTTKIADNPTVCLKTETKTNTVTRTETVTVEKLVYGRPVCTEGVEVSRGEGSVVCQVTNTVVQYRDRVKIKRVVKWKNRTRVIVKWKTRKIKICPRPKCPKGTTLIRHGKKWICAIEGSG